MKTLFLSIAMCFSLGLFTVSAQNSEAKSKTRSERNELNLTTEQKEQMKSIRKDFSKKMKELRKNETLSKDEMKAKRKELREAHHAQIHQILTPEQQQRFDELRKNSPYRGNKQTIGKNKENRSLRMADGRKHMVNKRRHSPMERLDLTDVQKEQIKNLKKEHFAKSAELKVQQRNEILSVLTPEQLTKLKQTQTERFVKRNRISIEGAEKLQALKENFRAEKSAIEKSRIASESQQQKIKDLKEKFKADRKEIIRQYRVEKEQVS